MGLADDGEVRFVSNDFAIYEIMRSGEKESVRFSISEYDESNMTEAELEASNVVNEGYLLMTDGEPGFYVDPYKAAESILAEHYGYAKMVESHYDWKPGIVY